MEPAIAALDHHLARGLLRSAVMWLEIEGENGRGHPWRAREIGAIAVLGGFGGLAARAERLLADPDHVHADDDDHSAHDPCLPHGDELIEMFPAYSVKAVLGQLRHAVTPHLRSALDRQWDEAWSRCNDDAEREEVVAVRALLCDFGGAIAMTSLADFPRDRRLGPLMVVTIEALRTGDDKLARRLVLDELSQHDGLDWWVPVASGLLGRVPWQHYPLPES